MAASLLTDRVEDVVVLKIANPTHHNALSPEICAAAIEVFNVTGDDPSVAAIVLTGQGEHFCSGISMGTLRQMLDQDVALQAETFKLLGSWVEAIRLCEKPVIAAVEGAAVNAGCAIALACDLIVAAEQAQFSLTYRQLGLSTDSGVSWLLSRRLPQAIAFEMAALAHPMSAARLASLGAVNKVCDKGKALQEALLLAHELAAGPREVTASIKQLLSDDLQGLPLTDYLNKEYSVFFRHFFAEDAKEGLQASLENRPARFSRNS
ncbi:MAG: enoyl-CoA hydratase/isomerase family protein [Burkholderiaceae bacterium]|nr:enoyl-CoA hydratase/isomerase family protein [Burkholderiaceae bacterium]